VIDETTKNKSSHNIIIYNKIGSSKDYIATNIKHVLMMQIILTT